MSQEPVEGDDATMLMYEVNVGENGELHVGGLMSHDGPLHPGAGAAPEAGLHTTPVIDKSGLPDGGKLVGLRMQLHSPKRYWQMWYPGIPSKCFSWGDDTKASHAGSSQDEALAIGVAWLNEMHRMPQPMG